MLDRSSAKATGLPALRGRSDALLARLADAGYDQIEPAILQPAAPFLDLGGEDIRGNLYFTGDRTDAELCLRPEYTIPVCMAYLASTDVGAPAAYAYCGPVFRFRASGRGELIQAGLESFGRTDTAAVDAEVLSLAVEAADAAGSPALDIKFSDAGLLAALLDALKLPANWQRRLRRGLDKGERTATILAAAQVTASDNAGVLAALTGADAKGARALVNDLLSIAGIKTVGGRTADEIADRFLSQVALRAAPPFGDEQRAILDRFLAVSGDPDEAALRLRAIVDEAKLDLRGQLDLFDERTSFMAADGIDLAATTYDAAFGRQLDYYTGFVFEARAAGITEGPVIGGGRYDRLAQLLGCAAPVPAVGAAIWLERLEQAATRTGNDGDAG